MQFCLGLVIWYVNRSVIHIKCWVQAQFADLYPEPQDKPGLSLVEIANLYVDGGLFKCFGHLLVFQGTVLISSARVLVRLGRRARRRRILV